MAESTEPQLPSSQRRRRFKLLDVLIFLIVVGVIAALGITLMGKLHLKHEVSDARLVSDRIVRDISTENAADARSLGDASFQAVHSTAQLKSVFISAKEVAKGHAVVDRQTVSNAKDLQVVNIIYVYPSKPPYYIRVAVAKTHSNAKWQLVGITGNSSEARLIIK